MASEMLNKISSLICKLKTQARNIFIGEPNFFNKERMFNLAVFLSIFTGIALRLYLYFQNRSFWGDEAFLGINIIDRNFEELLRPLDINQSAPILFLYLTKLLTLAFGLSESIFRLTPLLASIFGVFIFYLVCKRLLKRGGVIIALTLFAISPALLRYSQEFKPYSTDVLVDLILIYLCITINHKNLMPRFFWLSFLGGCCIFLSLPSVFTLSAIALCLLILKVNEIVPISWKALIYTFSFWGVCFLINYYFFLQPVAENHFFYEFFNTKDRHGFFPLIFYFNFKSYLLAFDPMALSIWKDILDNFLLFIGYPIEIIIPIYIILTISIFKVLKRPLNIFYLLLLTIIFLTFLASLLHIYPFFQRLILFLVPLIIILIARGMEVIYSISRPIGIAVSLFLLVHIIDNATLGIPPHTDTMNKSVLEYIHSNNKDNAPVYIPSHLRYQEFIFYLKKEKMPTKELNSFRYIKCGRTENKSSLPQNIYGLPKEVNECDVFSDGSIYESNEAYFIFQHPRTDAAQLFISSIIKGRFLELKNIGNYTVLHFKL